MEINRKFKDHRITEISVETPDTTTTTLHFEEGKLKRLFIWGKDGNSVAAFFDKSDDNFYYSAEGKDKSKYDPVRGDFLGIMYHTPQNQFQPVCQLIVENGHFAGLKMLQGIRAEDKTTRFVPMATISLNGEIIKEKGYERRVSCSDSYSYTNPKYWRQVKGPNR